MKTLRISGGDDRRILRILACRTNFDASARSSDNVAVDSSVAAHVFGAVGSENVEPDERIGAESAVAPVPARDVLDEGLVAPILFKVKC